MADKWKGRALGAILFETQMITQDDIERALDEQKNTGQRFGEALVSLSIVTMEDVHWGLSHQLDVPFVRIRRDLIDGDAVRLVPEVVARRHNVLPYLLIDDELTVVIDDPTNLQAIAELTELTDKRIIMGVGLAEEITAALDDVYGKIGVGERVPDIAGKWFSPEEAQTLTADHTGAAFVTALLAKAVLENADEIHFDPGEPVKVWVRCGDAVVKDVAVIGPSWMLLVTRHIQKMLRHTNSRENILEGFFEFDADGPTRYHVALVDTFGGATITMTRLSGPEPAPRLADTVHDFDRHGPHLERLWSNHGGLVVIVGTNSPRTKDFMRMLVEAAVGEDRKAVHVGHSPFLAGEAYIRLRPTPDDNRAHLESIEAALALAPDVLVVDSLMDPPFFNACLREAAGGKLVIGLLSLSSLTAAMEFMIDTADSRVVLTEALRGLVSFVNLDLLPIEGREPDDCAEQAAELFDISPSELAGAVLMRGLPEHRRRTHRALISVLPCDEELGALIKSGASRSRLAELADSTLRLPIRESVKQMLLAGDIELDAAKRALRSIDHGAT